MSFFQADGSLFTIANEAIIEKFQSITGISERKYAKNHHTASDLATFAAERAIDDASIDPEQLDYIIVGHNFGDVTHGHNQSDMLPALAARVKHQLGIQNPSCVAYDLIFVLTHCYFSFSSFFSLGCFHSEFVFYLACIFFVASSY